MRWNHVRTSLCERFVNIQTCTMTRMRRRGTVRRRIWPRWCCRTWRVNIGGSCTRFPSMNHCWTLPIWECRTGRGSPRIFSSRTNSLMGLLYSTERILCPTRRLLCRLCWRTSVKR
uniref:(northern house mosquito) hypothetical protein n=1 Tax=Culex pipiens TaxID=7175 RepID=A0A8D8HD15_CULPI